jgi:hypothetical protein
MFAAWWLLADVAAGSGFHLAPTAGILDRLTGSQDRRVGHQGRSWRSALSVSCSRDCPRVSGRSLSSLKLPLPGAGPHGLGFGWVDIVVSAPAHSLSAPLPRSLSAFVINRSRLEAKAVDAGTGLSSQLLMGALSAWKSPRPPLRKCKSTCVSLSVCCEELTVDD